MAVTSASLVAAATLAAVGSPVHAADDPPSTPVPITTPDGALFSYVVNADSPRDTAAVKRAIVKADGTVVQAWPQIGVVVAHSTNGDFRSDVLAGADGARVESVGATRTVPVSEGAPGVGGTTAYTEDKPHGPGRTFDGSIVGATVADPREGEQWDMAMIKADQAHAVTDGRKGVVVGVLDSGVDVAHPDLAAQVDLDKSVNCSDAGKVDLTLAGKTSLSGTHGTHVAGTIAAARNGVGIVGVAPGVTLASVKVVNDDGFIYPEYAVCGFMWAGLEGMDVTNNSYYVDPFEYYCEDQPDQYAAKEAVRRAVAFSTARGVVHAAAAGNAGTDLDTNTTDDTSPDDSTPVTRTINSGCHDIPTELPGVVTVSAIDQAGLLAPFSNRGLTTIDVAAPGRRILSTVIGGGYGLLSGTSMASPHVAGVLALMKSQHPTWSPARLVATVRAQADDHACADVAGAPCVGTDAVNSYYGEGVADALDAVG